MAPKFTSDIHQPSSWWPVFNGLFPWAFPPSSQVWGFHINLRPTTLLLFSQLFHSGDSLPLPLYSPFWGFPPPSLPPSFFSLPASPPFFLSRVTGTVWCFCAATTPLKPDTVLCHWCMSCPRSHIRHYIILWRSFPLMSKVLMYQRKDQAFHLKYTGIEPV